MYIDYLLLDLKHKLQILREKFGDDSDTQWRIDYLQNCLYQLNQILNGNTEVPEADLSVSEIQSTAIEFLETLSVYRGAESARALCEVNLIDGQKAVLSLKTPNKKITQIVMRGIADGLKMMEAPPKFNPISKVDWRPVCGCTHKPRFWLGE